MSDQPDQIHLQPLAYLVGLAGVALLRSFAGDIRDPGFADERLADVRRLLDAPELRDTTPIRPLSIADGYDLWAPVYDHQPNGLIDLEQIRVHAMLDTLPVGVALDAACGTGRHSVHLAQLGHEVIGVDASPRMLAVARERVPSARFLEGDLHSLELPDDHVDVIVCALALTHVPDLAPVFAEFARVLRPGGHLVISDSRGFHVAATSYPLVKQGADGQVGYIPGWVHPTSAYLNAGLALGMQVRACEEPKLGDQFVDPDVEPAELTPGAVPDEWLLHSWAPVATNHAYRGQAVAIFWHFQMPVPTSLPPGQERVGSEGRPA